MKLRIFPQCNIAVAACDNNPEVLGIPQQRAQTLVMFGDSLLRTGHPRKAESVLEKALLLRKCILKPKGATLGDYELMPDVGTPPHNTFSSNLQLFKLQA
jgi:hypothetical protein